MVFITALDVPLIPILLIANFLLPLFLSMVPCVGIVAVASVSVLLVTSWFSLLLSREVLMH